MSKPKKEKRFNYQLDTLLRVREIREKQEQDAYSQALQKLEEEKQKEEILKQQQNAAYQELTEMISSGAMPDMNHIQLRKRHIEVLVEKVEEQEKAVKAAEKAKETQREKLNQAVKERKIIEKDKEKTRISWRKLLDKEEVKFLDDIAGIGQLKKRRESEKR